MQKNIVASLNWGLGRRGVDESLRALRLQGLRGSRALELKSFGASGFESFGV